MSTELDREEVRKQVEGYYKLPYEEQVRLLELVRTNPIAQEEWHSYIASLEVVHYQGEEPSFNEEEHEVLKAITEEMRNDKNLGGGRRKWLLDTLSVFFQYGDLGAPLDELRRLNPYADDPEKSLRDNLNVLGVFLTGIEPRYTIQITHVPVRMHTGKMENWEVAKLVKISPIAKVGDEDDLVS